MKGFFTTGAGPDGRWRTDEERREGEAILRLNFVHSLWRHLGRRRVRLPEIVRLASPPDGAAYDSGLLWPEWMRIHWEWGELPPTNQRMSGLLKELEGRPPHRLNRRWSATEHSLLWGFDAE